MGRRRLMRREAVRHPLRMQITTNIEHRWSRPAGSWSPVVDYQTRFGELLLVASVSVSPDAFRNACSCSRR
jgi:hypothetical protein